MPAKPNSKTRGVRANELSAKNELRQRLRKILTDIQPEKVETKSLRAAHRLFEQPEYVKAEVVMVFLSLPTEIDTSPVVLRAWQDVGTHLEFMRHGLVPKNDPEILKGMLADLDRMEDAVMVVKVFGGCFGGVTPRWRRTSD